MSYRQKNLNGGGVPRNRDRGHHNLPGRGENLCKLDPPRVKSRSLSKTRVQLSFTQGAFSFFKNSKKNCCDVSHKDGGAGETWCENSVHLV